MLFPKKQGGRILGAMVRPSVFLFLGLLLGAAGDLWAQDTRGSLLPAEPLLLASGEEIPVEQAKVGELLRGVDPEGRATKTKITAIRRQHTDYYVVVEAGGRELHATGSHRILRENGDLVRIDSLKEGDKVQLFGKAGVFSAAVTSLRELPATLIAYDLMVEGHGAFVADGFVVGD